MGSLRKLPLFPLNTVLFPGMTLPLHIFEPRYRLMIGECVQRNRPFGAILIKEGQEVGAPALPYQVGTSAYVTQVDKLEDGRLNIQAVGYQRFKLHALQRHKPYLLGLVEDSPFGGEDNPANKPISNRLARALRAYLNLLKAAGDEKLSFDSVPDRSMALALLTAIVLPLPNQEKLALLACDDLHALLGMELALVRRENMLLNHMLSRSQREGDAAEMFSAN